MADKQKAFQWRKKTFKSHLLFCIPIKLAVVVSIDFRTDHVYKLKEYEVNSHGRRSWPGRW